MTSLNIEQAISVFIMFVAVFIALFRRILLKNQEFDEEKYKDTMEDELDDKAEETCANAYSDEVDLASIATEVKWICCGKVFQSMISLAIHTKRIHGKCCCYLTNAKTSVQCQDCDEKFTRKRSLKMSCTFCEKNLSSYPQLDSVIKTTHVSNDCCNCGFKSCFGNVLRTRLLVKHGIRIIQVKLSNCDKCSQTFVLKSNFGSHIQSSCVD